MKVRRGDILSYSGRIYVVEGVVKKNKNVHVHLTRFISAYAGNSTARVSTCYFMSEVQEHFDKLTI